MLKSIVQSLKYSASVNYQQILQEFPPLLSHKLRFSDESNRQPIDIEKLYSLTIKRKSVKDPYKLYIKSQFKKFRVENPEFNFAEIMAKAGASWKFLAIPEKKTYCQEAERRHEVAVAEIDKMFEGYADEEKVAYGELLKEIKKEKRFKKEKRKRNKELRLLGKPKRPMNAYGIFCASLDRGDGSYDDFKRGASLKWMLLTEQDKEEFREQQRQLTEDYQKRMEEWSLRMISEQNEAYLPIKKIKKLKTNFDKYNSETDKEKK